MSRILIGLAGKARVGKDTAGAYLAERFNMKRYAFAGPIKDAVEAMGFPRLAYDLPDMKEKLIPGLDVSYRHLLQTLGTEWGRSIHPDFWLLLAQIHWGALNPYDYAGMVITDVRFENEAEWIRKVGYVVHIDGPQRGELANASKAHASEAGLERLPGDIVVSNIADTSHLFRQLRTVVEAIRG